MSYTCNLCRCITDGDRMVHLHKEVVLSFVPFPGLRIDAIEVVSVDYVTAVGKFNVDLEHRIRPVDVDDSVEDAVNVDGYKKLSEQRISDTTPEQYIALAKEAMREE